MEDKIQKRYVNRYFEAILYKDDPNFENYMRYITKYYTEVTYIDHDRDVNENGEIKKWHRHILFRVGENARHLNVIAREIGIPGNYLQGINKDARLIYFTHKNNPEKSQYAPTEIQGELKNYAIRLYNKAKPEEERYKPILDAIQRGQIKTLTQLFCYGIGHNCIDEIKKCQFLLCKIIEEKWKQKEEKSEHNITN